MANQKTTDLTAITSVEDSDILMVVDDPGGTPASKKITVANFLGRAYGDMYVTGGSASQSIAAATWTKITQFTANGSSLNTTPDHTNDRISVDATGFYAAWWRVSWDSNTAADETEFALYWNSVRQDQTKSNMLASASTRMEASGFGIVDCTATSTYFELYTNITVGGGNVDIIEASVMVMKLGAT